MPAAEPSALAGLRVIDFSRFLPAAYAGWVAAEMGAEVIRVEHPRELAKAEAMFGRDADPQAAARRRARPTYHRGKRSLRINPGSAAGREVLHRLIASADVVIEDYRPGVMAAMGYGHEAMAALNPRLITLSVSFAGQTGPLADRAGHDPLALALAGALARLNGLPEPSLPGLQVADTLTGMSATMALLLALQARERRGTGEQVDVAMSDAALQLLLVSLGRHDDLDELPRPGTWHPKGGVWRCADGLYLCTTDMEPAYWARFCAAIDRPDLAARQHEAAAHPAMEQEIAAIMATRTRDEWSARLAAAGTQAMPVYSPAEAVAHPHHLARGMVREVQMPGPGPEQAPVRQLSLPFVFGTTRAVAPSPAGAPGADNAAILDALGFDPADLAARGAFSTEREA
ncbi:CoA transferase [Novosphingobium flavum]|uniref:CaiB/BaiF CoA transferase family protein n=1 Tax=Novosphingobium aerophilum TaxID=2839843 RepID=UPI001639506D|nr:CoA transferase [Novosphingobium aerophilum]MBC2661512.1 CoA transferase [Novosphingobium aerophilum]